MFGSTVVNTSGDPSENYRIRRVWPVTWSLEKVLRVVGHHRPATCKFCPSGVTSLEPGMSMDLFEAWYPFQVGFRGKQQEFRALTEKVSGFQATSARQTKTRMRPPTPYTQYHFFQGMMMSTPRRGVYPGKPGSPKIQNKEAIWRVC